MVTENLYVLLIAIELGATQEEAFFIYENGKTIKKRKSFFNDEDTKDMIKLRETLLNKELSEIYNLTESAISNRIKTFVKKMGENYELYKLK